MDTLLYTIRELFCDYLPQSGCKFFNIPEYQRGYKWTSETVTQLLEDLKNFKKGDDDSFYCIQNITVTKTNHNGNRCINVIDGQQRLTTLFILIAYLQRNMADKIINNNADILKYSIRDSTDIFLKKRVLSGELWASEIKPNSALSKDQYYMMAVASAIHEWFQKNRISPDTILDDLKLIVNEVEQGEEETVFASLNGGKVDLDGADLVRAILITRAAKQKYPSISTKEQLHQIANDDMDLNVNITISSRGKINEFRVKLGVELDEMNQWWTQKSVKDYYEQLLPNRISKNHSFKYSQYPIDLLYYAFYEAYKDQLLFIKENNDLDLRVFENGLDLNGKSGDDHLEFYNEVKEFHLTLMDWFNNDEIYNLLGYLMYNFKSSDISFGRLWKTWLSSSSKEDFINKIKDLIKKQIAYAFSNDGNEKEDALKNLRKAISDINFDWYNHPFTLKLLPLIDILPEDKIIKNKIKTVRTRIDPEYFRRISAEDKEHVRSQTRPISENLSENEKEQLNEENKIGLNSLGNIVLLHEGVNRSYGNDPHNKKMDRIISEFLIHDWFIRPHTFEVFTSKLNSIDDNGKYSQDLFWSHQDILRTIENIDRRLANYFQL